MSRVGDRAAAHGTPPAPRFKCALDGVSAAPTFRALLTPIASMPMIALTANTTTYDRDADTAAGITDCVT